MRFKFLVILSAFLITSFSFSLGKAQDHPISDRDKQYLINLARQTLYWYLKDGIIPEPDEKAIGRNLSQIRDCFVTLYKKGFGLRGCIGFGGQNPLYKNVIDRAIWAATRDSRFPRVEYSELKDIKIEISILTEPKEIKFDSPEDLLSKIRSRKDGVVLQTKYGGATFIPKVWEQIHEKEKFLSGLCMKHGAPSNMWKIDYKNIRVWTFQALEISEEMYGRRVIGKNGAIVGKKGAYVLGAVKPLQEGQSYGGYKVGEGTELASGAIVTSDSDILEK